MSQYSLIFVTGLAGHAFGSWKATNSYTMWIRDFLAGDIEHRQAPRVRILTYGYDSRLLSSTSAAGITEFAQGLLESVTNAHRLSDVCCNLRRLPTLCELIL
jgi:hypothetical protein